MSVWRFELKSKVARVGVMLVLLGASGPCRALADTEQVAQADALFAQGKEAMAAKEYPRACALLQESYALDPATGSLLALAICHEWENKLASALREYQEVLARSHAEARPDREQAASERATALRGVVSTLTLSTAELGPIEELTVRLDHSLVDPSVFNTAIAVDGGSHVITASAEGKQTWSVNVTVAAHHDAQTVMMPALEPLPVAQLAPRNTGRTIPIVRPVSQSSAPVFDGPNTEQFSAMQWAGTLGLSAGILTLGVGGLLVLRAVHDNNVENSGCSANGCVADPPQKPLTLGRSANVALVTGGVLSVAGIVLLVVARKTAQSSASAERVLSVAPWAAPHAAGAAMQGSF